MHPHAAKELEKLGADPSSFAARQLTPRIASEPDLIIAMERSHRDAVLELAPSQLRKTFTLHEAAYLVTGFAPSKIADLATLRPHASSNEVRDVIDPIGRSVEVYADVAAQIANALPLILDLCLRSAN